MLEKFFRNHHPKLGGLEILKYIGPGFLVTVGFIDPGNWASNVAAGSDYGYSLLWMVTLSTIMLVILQHNAAHLGIASGLCLAEASTKFFPKLTGRLFLGSAMLASISTALAELLGAAIGLNMLFRIPLPIGAALTAVLSLYMLFSRSYRRLEKWIIGFVSLIGVAFLIELMMVQVDWGKALIGWVVPAVPHGSMPIIMSVLGAVVMPHNIFLHSEIIQSRQWNLKGEATIRKQLDYEFYDTLFAMVLGWAINSAIIIVAASVFFRAGVPVSDLPQAEATLRPLVGDAAGVIFALALLLSGFASSITAGMASGTVMAGMNGEPFDIHDNHSRLGAVISYAGAFIIIIFLTDPFKGLIWSQIALSMQLPFTIIGLIALTSSRKVMGQFANRPHEMVTLLAVALIVIALNIMLLVSMF
jgi:manganese transport protein